MKKLLLLLLVFAMLFFVGNWWAEKNTIYNKDTWVKPFFTTSVSSSGQIVLTKQKNLSVLPISFGKVFMLAQAFFRIEGNVVHPEKKIPGNAQQIILQIHKERFNTDQPYVITGGNFAELYVRNFGIFYNAMLDSRIPSSDTDWITREEVTLQTIATDLELLKHAGKEYTTFIPIAPTVFVGANFNTDPSDSLFAIIYTLSAAKDPEFIQNALPTTTIVSPHNLQTQEAANQLIKTYKNVLSSAISRYIQEVIDPSSGLIKKNITLSSARDSIKRQSSFYDNVIAWATAKDATNLAISFDCPKPYTKNNSCDFDTWKQTIINAFWDDKDGLFINDLSDGARKEHTFTGEEFVVVPDHFFDMNNSSDKERLYKMILYVEKNKLDEPFPLFYATKNDIKNYDFFVRYFAPSYMGESIWSHVGQEYIESLILLSNTHPEFLAKAKNALDGYTRNITEDGGYAELYDKNGKPFHTFFYNAVLHTGWVINFEQAEMMYLAAQKNR